ncbi:MAG: hypothetical protein HYY84_00725 [Deltaproteobacteria bacterium]|nr:hypothetical protein [Deltaproteobacteria bacterium]
MRTNVISGLAVFGLIGVVACGGTESLGDDVFADNDVVDAQGAALKGDVVENPVGVMFSVRGTRYKVKSVSTGQATGKRCYVSLSSLKTLIAEGSVGTQPGATERKRIKTYILKRTETSDRTICAGKGDGCIVVTEERTDN